MLGRSNTVVRVKGTAGKAEEGGGSLAVKGLTATVWALFWRRLVIQGLYVLRGTW